MTAKVATATCEPTDLDLWNAAQAGDEAAFASFCRRHRSGALLIAGRICGSEAEDAVQAALLSSWRNRGSYRVGRGSVRNWFFAIVRNRAIDAVRRNDRRRENPTWDGFPEPTDPIRTEDLAIEHDTARELRGAVADLPERQRQVIELGYFSELTQTEIAARLGLPLGTVKGRNRAALRGLATVAA